MCSAVVQVSVGCLLVQVRDDYNRLLAELRTHRDGIHDVETSLADMRKMPLTEDVERLQQQVAIMQVGISHFTE